MSDFDAPEEGSNGDKPFGEAEDDLSFPTISQIIDYQIDDSDLILPNGYLEKGALTTFCGAPSVGKSRLAAQLAITSILGMGFIGWQTNAEGLSWMFLQSENSIRRLKADIIAMTASLSSRQRDMLDKQLFLHCLIKDTDGYLNLNDPDVIKRVKRAISHFRPGIVVGDPLTGFTNEGLDADKEMINTTRGFCRLIKEGDPKRTPLILHHAKPGLASAANLIGINRGAFGRNSKALLGLTRAQVNLAARDDINNEVLIVASGKCNNAEEFPPFLIELDKASMFYARSANQDMNDWQDKVDSAANGHARGRKKTYTRDQILGVMSVTIGLSYAQLAKECEAKFKMSLPSFKRLWKELKELGDIEETEKGKWCKKTA